MKQQLTRRDFIKLSSAIPLGLATSKLLHKLEGLNPRQSEQKNVLIIVFDAWSAYNISLYGYNRETTPHINRLAKEAIVYHNHYAGGNFTTPGTASLLTGTLPWTHRALQLKEKVIDHFIDRNIFSIFKSHYRIAYTHNPWADILLEQFSGHIDEWVPRLSLFLESYDEIIQKTFEKDHDIASVSWLRNTNLNSEGHAYSLFISHIYEALRAWNLKSLRAEYPRGIPSIDRSESYFLLDQAINWLGNRLSKIRQPFLGYFHFLPPHLPHRPSVEFVNRFANDGYIPLNKPDDVFSEKWTYNQLVKMRAQYDEFILYVDNQFNVLFEQLKNSGVLENTWVILTSDHGEMFERGIDGHHHNAMYEPVIKVPLMIFEPGRKDGLDIHENTSAIDVLPTLLTITGQEIPDWVEGKVLLPFTTQSSEIDRSVYAVRADKTDNDAPITQTSTTILKGRFKLHYYGGYEEQDLPNEFVKLFDIKADPEEMVDLSDTHQDITSELLNELKGKLDEANKPYS